MLIFEYYLFYYVINIPRRVSFWSINLLNILNYVAIQSNKSLVIDMFIDVVLHLVNMDLTRSYNEFFFLFLININYDLIGIYIISIWFYLNNLFNYCFSLKFNFSHFYVLKKLCLLNKLIFRKTIGIVSNNINKLCLDSVYKFLYFFLFKYFSIWMNQDNL